MDRLCGKLLLALAALALPVAALAGALRVFPVTLDLVGLAATGSVTLRNESSDPANVQIRVYRWTQGASGEDVLTPTTDVVASPPASTLAPGASYLVRVVRIAGPVSTGEESYRLLIDELPTPGRAQSGQVDLLVRQSVPVFFSSQDASPAQVRWQVTSGGSGLTVTATNSGAHRLKVTDLTVTSGTGAMLAEKKGLAGYVLGGSTRSWSFPAAAVAIGSPVMLDAANESRRIHAQATVQGAQ